MDGPRQRVADRTLFQGGHQPPRAGDDQSRKDFLRPQRRIAADYSAKERREMSEICHHVTNSQHVAPCADVGNKAVRFLRCCYTRP